MFFSQYIPMIIPVHLRRFDPTQLRVYWFWMSLLLADPQAHPFKLANPKYKLGELGFQMWVTSKKMEYNYSNY